MSTRNKYKSITGISRKKRVLVQIESAALKDYSFSKSNENTNSKECEEATVNKGKRKLGRNQKLPNSNAADEIEKSKDSTEITCAKKKRIHRGNSLNRKLKVKRKKKKTKEDGKKDEQSTSNIEDKPVSNTEATNNSDLKSRATERLKGSRFRYINEQLYTSSGKEAEKLFSDDPDSFKTYHEGFQSQANKWPKNPLDSIIKHIRKQSPSLIVADMGCGDARLSRSIKQTVHSFDFIALNTSVTACNMAKVPLKNESVDICVFCLSLMGTNIAEYLREANRILKTSGHLKVVEISSRLKSVKNFIKSLEALGFQLIKQAKYSDNYFILFEFEKVGKPIHKRPPGLKLEPCLYKRR